MMNNNIEILPMQKADLPTVTVLAKQLGYEATESEVSARFDILLGSSGEGLFVAKKNHLVVGWIHVHTVPASLLMAARAEIHALVVDESCRGHGIGKKLLCEAQHWVRQKGFVSVRLRSNAIREEAKKFYLREGYTILKTQNTFEKNLI